MLYCAPIRRDITTRRPDSRHKQKEVTEYMEALLEPAVIIPLIVTFLIGLLTHKLARLGDALLHHASLMPTKVHARIRALKWRNRKNLILDARNPHKVTWSIIRAYALLILFVLLLVFYMLASLIPPFNSIFSLPKSTQALMTSPIYILEALWLFQKEKAQELVKAAGRNITKYSK